MNFKNVWFEFDKLFEELGFKPNSDGLPVIPDGEKCRANDISVLPYLENIETYIRCESEYKENKFPTPDGVKLINSKKSLCVLQKEICSFIKKDKVSADNEIKRLKHDMTAVKNGSISGRIWCNEDFVAQFITAALHNVDLTDCLLHNEGCVAYLEVDVGALIGSKLNEMAERFLRDFGVTGVGKEAAFNSMIASNHQLIRAILLGENEISEREEAMMAYLDLESALIEKHLLEMNFESKEESEDSEEIEETSIEEFYSYLDGYLEEELEEIFKRRKAAYIRLKEKIRFLDAVGTVRESTLIEAAERHIFIAILQLHIQKKDWRLLFDEEADWRDEFRNESN